MRGRDYNKQIKINEYISAPDGFGGNTVSEGSSLSTWAMLVNRATSVNQRVTSLGLTELNEPLIFRIRYTTFVNGKNMSLTYNNQEYTIQSITDIDMMHRELEIVCTKNNG